METVVLVIIAGLTLLFTILVYRYMKTRDKPTIRLSQDGKELRHSVIFTTTADKRNLAQIMFTLDNDTLNPIKVTSFILCGVSLDKDKLKVIGPTGTVMVEDGSEKGRNIQIGNFPASPGLPARISANDTEHFSAIFDITDAYRAQSAAEALTLGVEVNGKRQFPFTVIVHPYRP